FRSVAIDGGRLAFPDHQRQWPRRPLCAIAEQPKVAHERAGIEQWNFEVFLATRSHGRSRKQRLGRLCAPDTPPIPDCRYWQVVRERNLLPVAAPKFEIRAAKRPDRCLRSSRAKGDV